MSINNIASLALVLLLTACAAPPSAVESQYEHATKAISQRQWEAAYRLLEDGLTSASPAVRERAKTLIAKHPEILQAAADTFSVSAIESTLKAHGNSRGLDIEKRRLDQFRQIASIRDYDTASKLIASYEAVYRAEIDQKQREQARKAEAEKQQREEASRARAQLKEELAAARNQNTVLCTSSDQCERVFALAQAYLIQNSDMKIQVATNTLVETFNATRVGEVAIRLLKVPSTARGWQVSLTATCKSADLRDSSLSDPCDSRLLRIYREFVPFVTKAQ